MPPSAMVLVVFKRLSNPNVGMLSNVVFCIKELLHRIPEENRIGFITINSSVQFYRFTVRKPQAPNQIFNVLL